MTLFTESRVRAAATRQTGGDLRKSFSILAEEASTGNGCADIFLSHSIKDVEIVLGARTILIEQGYSVYVDWIDSPELKRNDISPNTAKSLRRRMQKCSSLLYLSSSNSEGSKWMPWELGYFDGYRSGGVAILPIAKDNRQEYRGLEYLGIYPYVDVYPNSYDGQDTIWVSRSFYVYTTLKEWLQSGDSAISDWTPEPGVPR